MNVWVPAKDHHLGAVEHGGVEPARGVAASWWYLWPRIGGQLELPDVVAVAAAKTAKDYHLGAVEHGGNTIAQIESMKDIDKSLYEVLQYCNGLEGFKDTVGEVLNYEQP